MEASEDPGLGIEEADVTAAEVVCTDDKEIRIRRPPQDVRVRIYGVRYD